MPGLRAIILFMKYIVGIDEVGRGPVAGPVYVCAAMVLEGDLHKIIEDFNVPLRDSKKLTEKMRDKWFDYLLELSSNKKIRHVVSKCSNKEIDEKGIAVCIKACVDGCLEKLKPEKDTKVFLDGGLYAKDKFVQETIKKGDETVPIISIASIFAKVLRDREMAELANTYDMYDWPSNKGYGTKSHMDAIKKHGTSPLHRVSFLKNI